jgi:hypothetical protein
MYHRFGARITVIERGRGRPREDEDLSPRISVILEADGIDVIVDANNVRFTRRARGFDVTRNGALLIAGTTSIHCGGPPTQHRRSGAGQGGGRNRWARIHRRHPVGAIRLGGHYEDRSLIRRSRWVRGMMSDIIVVSLQGQGVDLATDPIDG